MPIPSEDEILATFDQLYAESVIIYGPHEKVEVDCGGYPLEFRICPSLLKKPHQVGAELTSSFDKSKKWGPGSDMYCPDERLILSKLNGGTHDLAINLFCVDRPQYVVLTTDSYRKQYEPLDIDDLGTALEMLRGLKDIYVIYNCSEGAGCSRSHKHLQGLVGPPRAFEAFVDVERQSTVPFHFFAYHFEQGFESATASDALDVYRDFLGKTRELLRVTEGDVVAHNVVLWNDWMIVVPRRNGMVGASASANAAGMLGSAWVTDQKYIDEWLQIGCRSVLEQLGVKRG
ncbi:hypothetical protein EJ04DRAFT_576467 [Polyplosphaeria fusca]|uniref:ATP adenylyltransferase n=1 Tax=Polyplosphaeria fusca TaxID=682080 RepID=A0A9P4QYC3_9PLEO|nr:hypothetical protein EJ04DRAFT_576467 [Polyplosphaeria fusca]